MFDSIVIIGHSDKIAVSGYLKQHLKSSISSFVKIVWTDIETKHVFWKKKIQMLRPCQFTLPLINKTAVQWEYWLEKRKESLLYLSKRKMEARCHRQHNNVLPPLYLSWRQLKIKFWDTSTVDSQTAKVWFFQTFLVFTSKNTFD